MNKELSDKKIEAGWHQTFSTNNPFCPCDLKSFTKAVKWAERNLASPQVAPEGRNVTAKEHATLMGAARASSVLVSSGRAAPVQVAPQPTPYVDSNPQLHVGESSFEDWYQNYLPNSVGHKQIARDAYAAGMGDPLVAPQDDARDAADVGINTLIAAIKGQIKSAKEKRVQLAPSFWGHDRGAGLPLSDLEDVILEWESHVGCAVPPSGWWCSRTKGHEGPCAARPVTLATPVQVAPDQRNAMRAFEAWYCSDGNYEPEELDKLAGGACYANADTENMWQAWQGAFLHVATPVQVAPQDDARDAAENWHIQK